MNEEDKYTVNNISNSETNKFQLSQNEKYDIIKRFNDHKIDNTSVSTLDTNKSDLIKRKYHEYLNSKKADFPFKENDFFSYKDNSGIEAFPQSFAEKN